jgi:hypothetical protein
MEEYHDAFTIPSGVKNEMCVVLRLCLCVCVCVFFWNQNPKTTSRVLSQPNNASLKTSACYIGVAILFTRECRLAFLVNDANS